MANLQISTELDNRAFVPGDRIRGRISWSDLPEPPASAELRLFHYTSGKGTRDIDIIETRSFEAPLATDQQDFEFNIPTDSPPSFSGKLVSLLWAIELVITTDKELSERLEFQLSPTGTEVDLYAYAEGNAEKFRGGKKPWFHFNSK